MADLCTRMAILSKGEVLLTGTPRKAMDELRGRVWEKTVPRAELEAHQAEHAVISSHLSGGDTVIHVLADSDPGDGFSPAEPDLKDVYFTRLRGVDDGAAAETAETPGAAR